jgi:hypothetical protein
MRYKDALLCVTQQSIALAQNGSMASGIELQALSARLKIRGNDSSLLWESCRECGLPGSDLLIGKGEMLCMVIHALSFATSSHVLLDTLVDIGFSLLSRSTAR